MFPVRGFSGLMRGKWNMIRLFSVKRKKVIHICTGILLFMIVGICVLYFSEEQIQHVMKKTICKNVIKYEDELLEITKECSLEEDLYYYDDNDYYKTIYYMDLEDENINRIFKIFRLLSVDKNEDNSVEFNIRPTVITVLWDNYMYGFYYTENDEPIDAAWGEDVEENEFEALIVGVGEYWYRTEKITDHWWFYETKTLWLYPSAHRR